MSSYVPIFETTRGDTVESIHYGAAVVVDSNGTLLAWVGDPHAITFLRSTAKPFQALPFIERGGDKVFGLSPREIAIFCASHAGTDLHVDVIHAAQEKIGIQESDLQCGVHPPFDKATAERLIRNGEEPTPNRHNCSGKHTGMLAHAKMRGLPLQTYLDPSHPIQQDILKTFAEMCDLSVEEVHLGIDGCSAPNFAVPLYNAALAYARLCDPKDLPKTRAEACRTITSAMTAHPEMISGYGRFDTRLMEVGKGKILSKGGAEGYQGIGLMPGALAPNSPGIGIMLKVSDGDAAKRVRPAVILEILRRLRVLDEGQMRELAEFGPLQSIYNWRKLTVGESRPVFTLSRA